MNDAKTAALPDLDPADIVVDVVCKAMGGFAPDNTSGVRVTHKPSGVSVTVDSERSQHKNKHLAWEKLRAILAALQPAAAVSDERQLLREIVENHAESLQALGDELRQRGVTQISYYGPQAEVVAKAMQLIDRARAILALRPQAVPMPEPVQRLSRYAGQTMRTARNPNITAREAIEIGDYLAAIGITAQGAQGGEG